MASKRSTARQKSLMIAFCGMAAGLSVVIMMLGGLIPVATYAVPMLCGLLLLPILMEFGQRAAWATFFSAAALALLLDADKEAAFFYLFIGYYPIVKGRLDRIRGKAKRIAVKLLLFTAAIAAMYALLSLAFPLAEMTQELKEMGLFMMILFVAVYDFSMLLYDRLLLRAAAIYAVRIRPRLRLLRR